MERCKFCGEVLEFGTKFCPACGKDTEKTPSKKFLKDKAKREAFVINNDARLYRVSYRIFGVIFLILAIVSFVFYGQYLFISIGNEELAGSFVEAINKVFDINSTINDFLPFGILVSKEGEVQNNTIWFNLVFYGGAALLTIFSLFVKKRASVSATLYKVTALLGLVFLIVNEVLLGYLPETYMDMEKVLEILTYVVAGITVVTFLTAFIFGFKLKNPYRSTLYQGFKALYFCGMVWLVALSSFVDAQIISDLFYYLAYNPSIYLLVASILLFIGSNYRGDISRLV